MRTLAILLLTSLSILIRPAAAAGCDVPLEPTRTSFVTSVRIGPAGPYRFLFDTGTSQTVLTPETARQSSLTVTGTTRAISAGGMVEVQRSVIPELHLGSVTIPELPVLIVPLPRFASHGKVDGILGMDVLGGRSFLLDVRRRCVTLDVNAAQLTRGTPLEATTIAGRVAFRARGLNFVLDSAASFVVLMSRRAAALASSDGTLALTTAAGNRRVRSAVIPRIALGEVTLRDLSATVVEGSDPREDALLPVTIFSSVFVSADRSVVVLNGSILTP